MSDITIVTDSISCLTRELVDRYKIEIIPFTLFAEGRTYRDGVDITPSQAYELFAKEPEAFKTAPATPRECLDILCRVSQKAKYILCITVSDKISTFYKVMQSVRETAKTELPDTKIEILDSETAAASQGFVVLAAARAVEAGKSFEETIESAQQMKSKVNAIVLLDTVHNVYRSGRVPKIAAQAASVLNIHPLFNLYGTVHFVTAARSQKIGIERMLKIMQKKVNNSTVHCTVMHAYAPDQAQLLKQQVAQRFICKELWISEFSPIMGYTTGTGTLGLAFYTEN
jgi:DegV family protein with EDD domain